MPRAGARAAEGALRVLRGVRRNKIIVPLMQDIKAHIKLVNKDAGRGPRRGMQLM